MLQRFGFVLAAGLVFLGLGLAVTVHALRLPKSPLKALFLHSASLNLPWGIGSVELHVSRKEKETAWQMYVQLMTRKAALPFDEDNDVIADVHRSLYELFKVYRELLAALPVDDAARESGLARLTLRVLNDGLRPYLTRWHSRYDRWWQGTMRDEASAGSDCQTLQKGFPDYGRLITDLKEMNGQMRQYAAQLLRIAA